MRNRPPSAVIALACLAAAIALAYVSLLAWDQHKDVDPVTRVETGPYSAWQVIACGVIYMVATGVAGRWAPVMSVIVAPLTFTLLWIADNADNSIENALWPVGAISVGFATVIGALIAVGITRIAMASRGSGR